MIEIIVLMSKRVGNNKAKRGQNPRRELISHPPQLNGIELRHSVVLRFRATAAAVQTSVVFRDLLDTLLVAKDATSGTDLFQTVRLRAVEVWGMPAVGGTASVAVEFSSTINGIAGDQALHTDTSMGVQPAHVMARPSAKALCSNYQVSTTAPAFLLTCPAGSVIDLHLSFRSQYATANSSVNAALVGATAGAQYIRGFDGLATATSNFVPEYTFGQI